MRDYGYENTKCEVPVADRETVKGAMQDVDDGLKKLYDTLINIDITINGSDSYPENNEVGKADDSVIGTLLRHRGMVMRLCEIAWHIKEGIG